MFHRPRPPTSDGYIRMTGSTPGFCPRVHNDPASLTVKCTEKSRMTTSVWIFLSYDHMSLPSFFSGGMPKVSCRWDFTNFQNDFVFFSSKAWLTNLLTYNHLSLLLFCWIFLKSLESSHVSWTFRVSLPFAYITPKSPEGWLSNATSLFYE